MKRTAPIYLILIAVLLTGCGRSVHKRVEHAITDALPKYLGPAEKYTATVSGRTDAIARGHINSVHVEGKNVALMPDLIVHQVQIDVTDVSIDPGSHEIKNIGPSRFSGKITEKAVNAFVARRSTRFKNVTIALKSGNLAEVTTTPQLMGMSLLPVSLRGRVSIGENGTSLNFLPDRASMNVGVGKLGTGIPDALADSMAAQLNPVADLSEVSFPLVADSITVGEGEVTILGHIPPGELRKVISQSGPK